jgi:serine/alanine adding enzyme
MKLRIVNQLKIDKWRDFVDHHPKGNIFHTPEMFDVYFKTRGYNPSLWAVKNDEGEILALHVPVHITLMGGVFNYFTTRNVNFGSVLVRNDIVGKEALSLLLETYNRSISISPLYTELRNLYDLSDYQDIFQNHGYQYESHLNYFVDLDRDHYDILQSYSRSARRDIRSTMRKGNVIVKEIVEPEMLPLFYELIKRTYSHARIPLADFSLFQAAFKILGPKKMVRFTIAFVNGTPASAAVSLLYKDVVYGWYNGVDRSFRSDYPNEVILWNAMRWGSENGFKIFDFGGAGKPEEDSSVRDFKLKFRGDLIEFGRNVCVHAPFRLNLAKRIYSLTRKTTLLEQI